MHQPSDRPIGVTVLAALVALKGLVSLAMAVDLVSFDLARSTRADEPVAAVALVTGLALLWRAYRLWGLHRGAWLVMLVLVALDGTAAAWQLLTGTRTATVWLSLAVAVVTASYLLQPGVRNRFLANYDGSGAGPLDD